VRKLSTLLACAAGALVLASSASASYGGIGPVSPVSPNGEKSSSAYWLVFALTAGIFVLVEGAHFTPNVERLIRGKTATVPGPDIAYTLRVYPNHPRALHSMMNLSLNNRTDKPEGSTYTMECWFERAERFVPDDGTVLLMRNLGTPVPMPLNCTNNGPHVGINSTPVIDFPAKALYVVAYTLISGTPTYQLFALNLNDLTNKISPVTVAASHTLSDGRTTYNFDAKYQRQRPALLLSSGNIYAGFGSFCDFNHSKSRGWLLGWQASTLIPLAIFRWRGWL
jgi:hypothetical protein